ncbi:MAG: hypothetical protein KF708_10075 [Pirellulales bacterium]|nr:hypothetical protein [Pirellulales bacterium]
MRENPYDAPAAEQSDKLQASLRRQLRAISHLVTLLLGLGFIVLGIVGAWVLVRIAVDLTPGDSEQKWESIFVAIMSPADRQTLLLIAVIAGAFAACSYLAMRKLGPPRDHTHPAEMDASPPR